MKNTFTNRTAGWLAFTSIGVLIFNAIFVSLTGFEAAVGILGPAYRLLLIPTVAILPAPQESKIAGFMWVFIDSTINIATLNGLDLALGMPLVLGIHLAFGVWAIGVGWMAKRMLRWAALLAGSITAGYSFVAPWAPEWILPVTGLLLLFFIFSAGRYLLNHPDEEKEAFVKQGSL